MRHKVYNCMDTSLHQYRNWICLRTLNVPLAVYEWPRFRPPVRDLAACPSPDSTLIAPTLQHHPRIPLHLRACPLGCPAIADLSHFLLYCLPARNYVGTHLPLIVGPPSVTTIQGLLNDKTADSRALLTTVSHCTHLARKHYKAPPAPTVLL